MWLTVKEVAVRLKVSRATVYKLRSGSSGERQGARGDSDRGGGIGEVFEAAGWVGKCVDIS